MTPGIDLTLDFTVQVEQLDAPASPAVVSLTVMCPARFFAVFSGYFPRIFWTSPLVELTEMLMDSNAPFTVERSRRRGGAKRGPPGGAQLRASTDGGAQRQDPAACTFPCPKGS